jgi:hypothetical protein
MRPYLPRYTLAELLSFVAVVTLVTGVACSAFRENLVRSPWPGMAVGLLTLTSAVLGLWGARAGIAAATHLGRSGPGRLVLVVGCMVLMQAAGALAVGGSFVAQLESGPDPVLWAVVFVTGLAAFVRRRPSRGVPREMLSNAEYLGTVVGAEIERTPRPDPPADSLARIRASMARSERDVSDDDIRGAWQLLWELRNTPLAPDCEGEDDDGDNRTGTCPG